MVRLISSRQRFFWSLAASCALALCTPQVVAKEGDLLWSYTAPLSTGSPALAPDNTLLVPLIPLSLSTSQPPAQVVGLDAKTGATSWSLFAQVFSSQPLMIGPDGTTYLQAITSAGAGLHAITEKGRIKWSIPDAAGRMAASRSGTIFLFRDYVGLSAITPDGSQSWAWPSNNGRGAGMLISADGTLYLLLNHDYGNSGEDILYAFTQGGALKWQKSFNPLFGNFLAGSERNIYVRLEDGLQSIGPDGAVNWRSEIGPDSLLVNADGNLLIVSHTNSPSGDTIGLINLVSARTREIFWTHSVGPAPSQLLPALAQDGTSYYVTGGTLYALDPNGNEKWHAAPPSPPGRALLLPSAPTIGPDGTVYVTDQFVSESEIFGRVHAFSASIPLANRGWPETLHDSALSSSAEATFSSTILSVAAGTNSLQLTTQIQSFASNALAYVAYGTTLQLGSASPGVAISNGTTTVPLVITNLLPATAYYYRIVVTNQTERVESDLQSSYTAGPAGSIALDEASLRAALLAGGSITFRSPGTLKISAPLEISKDTSISGQNLQVTLQGNGQTRLFHVQPGVRLDLNGIKLQGGIDAPPVPAIATNGVFGRGGAILNEGHLFLTNAVISDCSAVGMDAPQNSFSVFPGAGLGGAIYNAGGTVEIRRTTFSNCVAQAETRKSALQFGPPNSAFGGAIYNDGGSIENSDTVFIGNSAGPRAFALVLAFGGAYASYSGSNRFERCVWRENSISGTGLVGGTAPQLLCAGGALWSDGGEIITRNCLFERNRVALLGGGAPRGQGAVQGGAIFSNAQLSIENCSFLTNEAQAGGGGGFSDLGTDASGGAVFSSGPLAVVNSTFYQNVALCPLGVVPGGGLQPGTASGGAIYSSGGGGITNCTFAENLSSSPDVNFTNWGIHAVGQRLGANLFSTSNAVTVLNSLFQGSAGQTNVSGLIADAGHNISSDQSPSWTKPGSLNYKDARLGALAYYGGQTPLLGLMPDSPAIDAAEAILGLTEDQRGHLRPYGTAPDIGAFELSPPYTLIGLIQGNQLIHEGNIKFNEVAFPLAETNRFELSGYPAGLYPLAFSAPGIVFSPSVVTASLKSDLVVTSFAYRSNALTVTSPPVLPQIIFAGASNSLYRVEETTDLVHWNLLLETNLESQVLQLPFSNPPRPFEFFRVKGE